MAQPRQCGTVRSLTIHVCHPPPPHWGPLRALLYIHTPLHSVALCEPNTTTCYWMALTPTTAMVPHFNTVSTILSWSIVSRRSSRPRSEFCPAGPQSGRECESYNICRGRVRCNLSIQIASISRASFLRTVRMWGRRSVRGLLSGTKRCRAWRDGARLQPTSLCTVLWTKLTVE